MRESDFDDFGTMLDAVCSLLSRGAYTPSATNTALFFRALAQHDLAAVRAGFDAHVADPQRGRFVPTPADILAQISGAAANDGRPGADEAWAIAMRAADEAETVVWTAEIATAWQGAKPVLDAGDEVGARMAFRGLYERIVEAARAARVPAGWVVSLGFDAERRDAAIARGVALGQLQHADVLRLAGPSGSFAQQAAAVLPDWVKERLAKTRAELTAPREPVYVQPLDGAAMPEPIRGKFTPPDEATLPPGMRPKRNDDWSER